MAVAVVLAVVLGVAAVVELNKISFFVLKIGLRILLSTVIISP